MFKIGTLADWFGLGIQQGIIESKKCGATGVQLYAANEFDPRTAKQEFIDLIKKTAAENGQDITALCCELGGYGLELEKDNQEKIAYLKKCGDLAKELNCPVLTTHVGVIPSDKNDLTYQVMLKACKEIGAYLAASGITLAIETGPDSANTLRMFIEDCGEGIGVNFDPANFVMVGADDEINAVKVLGKYIVHTHAKDGRYNKQIPADEFYHHFAEGDLEWMAESNLCYETPLGQGLVRWDEYLAALKEVGYKGYLTIEHEIKDGADEIREAVDFLKEKTANM